MQKHFVFVEMVTLVPVCVSQIRVTSCPSPSSCWTPASTTQMWRTSRRWSDSSPWTEESTMEETCLRICSESVALNSFCLLFECLLFIHSPSLLFQNLYESIKNEPFKIPEDDGNDLTHTFFNPDREGWLLKLGEFPWKRLHTCWNWRETRHLPWGQPCNVCVRACACPGWMNTCW